jgi:hypothetical protein
LRAHTYAHTPIPSSPAAIESSACSPLVRLLAHRVDFSDWDVHLRRRCGRIPDKSLARSRHLRCRPDQTRLDVTNDADADADAANHDNDDAAADRASRRPSDVAHLTSHPPLG